MKQLTVTAAIWLLTFSTLSHAGENKSLSVRDAERIALENHPAARAAEAALGASRGSFWRGVSPPAPDLSLDYSYVPLGQPLNSYGEKTLELSQSLDFPLVTIVKAKGLSNEVSARESDVAAARLAVAADAKLAYIQTLGAQQRMALAQENLAIADSFLREAGIRANVGEGTQLELLTARVQQIQAANTVETARTTLTTTQHELWSALGLPAESFTQPLILTDSLVFAPLDLSLDSLRVLAQELNPRVSASEWRAGTARAERTRAWMSWLPSLNLAYYRQTVGDNPNFYGMRFGISLPVWFLLDNRGQVQEANAALAAAHEEVRAVRNAISLEIAAAFAAYVNSRHQVALQRHDILPQAEEIYRVASASYHAGEAGYVEFLQALQTVNAARLASLESLVEFHVATVRLEKALGRPLRTE